ncbi:hypothetical protein SDC9_197929 [bioreactor metagenome]|uniref:Uncharacterized protein n=1 Tax=bioreactor metagenome TaxID=1076179 RepID=A0A645ISX1_9ZZZZ
MVVEGRGNDLWEIAVNKSNMLNIPIATALAMDYPPKFDSSGSNGSKSYEFEFLLDWVYSYDVSLTASNLTFSTDFNDIYIKLVDLTAGTDITSFILVNNTQTIDISTLPIGCRYSIMMYVYDDEVLTPIATNYNFCKEGNGNN